MVVAPETRRLALHYFEYQDLGEHQFKGLPAPARAYQVLAERTPEVRFEARELSGITPLVGRAEELALILRRWDQVKEGEGQVVLLSGEPGIGKSRLAQVLSTKSTCEPNTLVRYQCSPYHTNSACSIRSLNRSADRPALMRPTTRKRSSKSWRPRLHPHSRTSRTLRRFLQSCSRLMLVSAIPSRILRGEALKEAILKVLVGQFFALSAKQPLLLIVEDAQWIDPTTQDLLNLLLPNIADERIMAAVTYRPDYRPQWSGLAHALTLPIGRLPRREVVLMIENVVGGKPLPPEVLEQIVAKTDGIPLFVEELTKTILESGLIAEADDSYQLSGAFPEVSRSGDSARQLDGAARSRGVDRRGRAGRRLHRPAFFPRPARRGRWRSMKPR